MYGMNFSGGRNKTHGQIERTDRIDSFEVHGDCGLLMASRAGYNLPLWYDLEAQGSVELSYPGSRWRTALELSFVPSGFGGYRTFWLYPCCGKRARYLYFRDQGFVCRECAKLNYKSQQRTLDSINHARDGLKLAREKLRWEQPFYVPPADFPHVTPDKPKWMHKTTYFRYLARYRRYQEKYQRESLREALAILRW